MPTYLVMESGGDCFYICNENLKKGEFIYIIVFSVLSLLLGLESFVTHFVAFVFGIIVGLLLQKKSKDD